MRKPSVALAKCQFRKFKTQFQRKRYNFFLSAFLQNYFLCWDYWNGTSLHVTQPCYVALGWVLIWAVCRTWVEGFCQLGSSSQLDLVLQSNDSVDWILLSRVLFGLFYLNIYKYFLNIFNAPYWAYFGRKINEGLMN